MNSLLKSVRVADAFDMLVNNGAPSSAAVQRRIVVCEDLLTAMVSATAGASASTMRQLLAFGTSDGVVGSEAVELLVQCIKPLVQDRVALFQNLSQHGPVFYLPVLDGVAPFDAKAKRAKIAWCRNRSWRNWRVVCCYGAMPISRKLLRLLLIDWLQRHQFGQSNRCRCWWRQRYF